LAAYVLIVTCQYDGDLALNPAELFSANVTITSICQLFFSSAHSSFYFRKRYTGTCSCSLCAVEKPGVLSHKDGYLSISEENHEIENHEEMAELSLEN